MPIYHGNNQYGNSNAWWIFHFGQPNSSLILLSFCEMSPLQHTSNVINRFVLLLVLPSPDIYIHLIWQYTRNDRATSEEMLLRDISFLLRTLSTLQCISQNYHFSFLYRLIIFFEPKKPKRPKRPKRPVDRVFSGLWTERCQYIPCHAAEVQESFMLRHAILRIYLKNTSRSRVFERVEVHLNGPNAQIPRWKRYFQMIR